MSYFLQVTNIISATDFYLDVLRPLGYVLVDCQDEDYDAIFETQCVAMGPQGSGRAALTFFESPTPSRARELADPDNGLNAATRARIVGSMGTDAEDFALELLNAATQAEANRLWIRLGDWRDGRLYPRARFAAVTQDTVSIWWDAALEAGAEPIAEPRVEDDDEGESTYAVVADPDGNEIEVIYKKPKNNAPAPPQSALIHIPQASNGVVSRSSLEKNGVVSLPVQERPSPSQPTNGDHRHNQHQRRSSGKNCRESSPDNSRHDHALRFSNDDFGEKEREKSSTITNMLLGSAATTILLGSVGTGVALLMAYALHKTSSNEKSRNDDRRHKHNTKDYYMRTESRRHDSSHRNDRYAYERRDSGYHSSGSYEVDKSRHHDRAGHYHSSHGHDTYDSSYQNMRERDISPVAPQQLYQQHPQRRCTTPGTSLEFKYSLSASPQLDSWGRRSGAEIGRRDGGIYHQAGEYYTHYAHTRGKKKEKLG